jgi:Tol biopolymer transport system component
MLRPACVSLAAVIAIGALLSCDDGDVGATVFLPPRRSFDDGRELFFSKQGRDVKWLSWAPDGRRFVYVDSVGGSDFLINIYDTVSKEDRVLLDGYGSRVLWSPKGDYILFHESDYSYSIIKPDGTGRKRVIQGSFKTNDYDASWSPDGENIVWSAIKPPDYRRCINILDVGTGEVTRITRDKWGNEEYPLWNPQRDMIAFYKTDAIVHWTSDWTTPLTLVDPGGNKYDVIWRGNDRDGGLCKILCDWSRKGRYVLFAAVTETGGPGYWELWVLDVETRRFKQITSTADPNWWDYDGVFGPDGMVYFVVRNGRGDCKDIWRVDPKL